MPFGFYLCGCRVGPRPGYPPRYIGRVIDSEGRITVPGEEVCPEHGQRVYGFRTILQVGGPQGHDRLDSAKSMGFKPSRWEPQSEVEDIRDNRDPAEVAAEIERKRDGTK